MDDSTKELIDRLFARQVVLTVIVQEIAVRIGCANDIAQQLRAVSSNLRTRDAAINIDPVIRTLLTRMGSLGSAAEGIEQVADELAMALEIGNLPRT